MKLKIALITLVSFFALVSCYKTPTYSNIPHIEFVSFSVSEPYMIGDTGNLRISFTDGDGDIGDPNASNVYKNLFLFKSFLPDTAYPYVVPYIPPKGTTSAISGYVDLKLAPIIGGVGGLLDPATVCFILKHPQDTVSFKMYLVDRAGNKSNEITTPPLVVRCP